MKPGFLQLLCHAKTDFHIEVNVSSNWSTFFFIRLEHLYGIPSPVDFLVSNKEQDLPPNTVEIICSLLYLTPSFMISTLWQCSWNCSWVTNIQFLNGWYQIPRHTHPFPCYTHRMCYSLILVLIRNKAKTSAARIIQLMGKICLWYGNRVQDFRQSSADTKTSGSCSNTCYREQST